MDFARLYRPDAAFLFGRLRKDRLLAIARATLGEAWAAAHRNDRKAALAEAMEAAFAAGAAVPLGVSPSGRAAALAWVPPGFRGVRHRTAAEAEAETEVPVAEAASGEAPPPTVPVVPEEGGAGETAHEDGAGAASQTPPALPATATTPARSPALPAPQRLTPCPSHALPAARRWGVFLHPLPRSPSP